MNRREKNYEDSARFAAFGMAAGVILIIGMIAYNIIVNGIG